MPVSAKIFTYEVEGLSYTVTVYEVDGTFQADITVTEGAMDVNALYFGDDDQSGSSASLSGPLNMNGARLEGEAPQWDSAIELSSPGLGPEGTGKETYLTAGDTLTVELDISSLDDIDVFGIRATSTSTPEGSIKAVSDDPEEPEPEDPDIDKIGFGYLTGDNGGIEDGYYFGSGDLEDGQAPTFANYVGLFEAAGGEVDLLETVIIYETDDAGDPVELFRIDAPEDGFVDAEDLIEAYEDALEGQEEDESLSLMSLLSLNDAEEAEELPEEEEEPEDEVDLV